MENFTCMDIEIAHTSLEASLSAVSYNVLDVSVLCGIA
jgi:hypothetical protein